MLMPPEKPSTGARFVMPVASIERSLAFVRGQHSTKYGAVTTWGSVFSKPSPKPSQTAQIGGVMPQINLLE